MPSGDKSGPMGQGSMTGRSLGFCAGYDTPGYSKGFGGGMGRGRGMGRGFGRNRNFGNSNTAFFRGNSEPEMNNADELKMLKSQAESLKNSLQNIEKRLNDLGKEDN